ncbi:MAG: hypothetical protein AAB492_02150 [Patescibacteria group bacterium]
MVYSNQLDRNEVKFSNSKESICYSAQKLELPISVGYVVTCNNSIFLGNYPTDSFEDFSVIESKSTFLDLFEYNKVPIIKLSTSFPKNDPQFIAITGIYDTGFTNREALGVYRITNSKVTRAFKRGFNDVSGRWTGFEFSDTKPEITVIGDLGALGCAGCRIEWRDYYIWNDQNNSFELNNSSHQDEYRKLLAEYEKYRLDDAETESLKTFDIAKSTIRQIIQGENTTFKTL